jgi:hypothetical protein
MTSGLHVKSLLPFYPDVLGLKVRFSVHHRGMRTRGANPPKNQGGDPGGSGRACRRST